MQKKDKEKKVNYWREVDKCGVGYGKGLKDCEWVVRT